jgi:cytochrome b involved in lipid metabolism
VRCFLIAKVTAWMESHPGGKIPLVNWSGKDASVRFAKVHKDPKDALKRFGRRYRIGCIRQQKL